MPLNEKVYVSTVTVTITDTEGNALEQMTITRTARQTGLMLIAGLLIAIELYSNVNFLTPL